MIITAAEAYFTFTVTLDLNIPSTPVLPQLTQRLLRFILQLQTTLPL
jgi:hypothetical protein